VILGRGGGYYCLSSAVEITDSVFTENQATGSGGGIYFVGSDQNPNVSSLLHNCLVTDNRAGRDGGGISCNWRVEPIISNCTIVGNEATGVLAYGGGLYCSYQSNVKVIDSIIWDNLGIKGSQVAVGVNAQYEPRPSTVDITYSDIQGPVEPTTAIDLVFCIDTTGSMGGAIDAVKDAATQIVGQITDVLPDFRIAVVDYRDFNEPNYGDPNIDYPYNDDLVFNSDVNEIVAGISSIELGSGWDWPESVFAALMHCIDHSAVEAAMEPNLHGADPNSQGPGEWRSGDVKRVIIIMGDAPPHEPEPFTGYTIDDVVHAAREMPAPKTIFSIVTGYGVGDPTAEYYFGTLAQRTGGVMFEAAEAGDVVGAFMDAIALLTAPPIPIYVEESCTLNWWDPNDPNDPWDPNSGNISKDPNFILGYYLSHFATGQDGNSPCVDAGSDLAENIGLHTYTTRIDSVNDINKVDMGYHYRQGLIQYDLTITVVDANGVPIDPNDPNLIHGTVEPNRPKWVVHEPNTSTYSYFAGTQVVLIADPCEGYRVKVWTGTDNVPAWNTNENTVTMTSGKDVTVAFEPRPVYQLYLIVDGNGTLEANSPEPLDVNLVTYYDGTEVFLIATPNDPNYEVKVWSGTDDDSSRDPNNTVTINGSDAYVTVEFGLKGQNDIYIERDPNTFYPTIQDAIDAAIYEGDVVIVTDGIYTGPGNRDLHFMGVPITVQSKDGPGNCFISCGGMETDPHRGFIFDSNEDPNYIVRGFTISGGYADFGGGLYYLGESGPWVDNCIITGNTATDGGGGVYFQDTASDADGEDANDADDANAVIFVPTISNCKIFNNASELHGGGIYCTNASPRITNTEISNNTAGGWFVAEKAFGGGVYGEAGSAPEIINCLITSNSSSDIGGSIYLLESPATILFCTVMYNDGLDLNPYEIGGEGPKGGICCRDSEPTISHCIIGRNCGIWGWGLWGDEWWYGDDLYNCSATYSCIENGDEGEGNISDDPLFISGGLGAFYLSQMQSGQVENSPCVDAGQEYALSDLLDDPNYVLGYITTSIQNHSDSGNADMGFHYPFYDGPPVMYTLTLYVTGNGHVRLEYYDPNYNTVVVEANSVTSPLNVNFVPGDYVTLIAVPDPNHRILGWSGTDDDSVLSNYNIVTMYSHKYVTVAFEPVQIRTLHVGGEFGYTDIQMAIDEARDGDTITIADGEYAGTGFTVLGKNITIVGNPANPERVVVDCENEIEGGFHILGTPGGTCVLDGVTIKNINTYVFDAPAPEDPRLRGIDGGDNLPDVYMDTYGSTYTGTGYIYSRAAISVVGNHIIKNCIIRDCSVTGGNASGGNPGGEDYQRGGNGGNGGNAGAAGIYIGDIFDYDYVYDPNTWSGHYELIRWGGSPTIINCIIENCSANGADGGNGGNGAKWARGGSGGLAGQAVGAGIFCDVRTKPTFINCDVTNCQATAGNGGNGGDGGQYGAGGYGGLTYADPNQGDPRKYSARGGGVYCAVLAEPNFVGCTFSDNVTDGSVSGVGGFSDSGVQEQPRRNYNIASYGAGVHCASGCSATFKNCTVQGNETTYYESYPTGYGGGISFEGSRTSIDPNSVLFAYGYGYSYGYYGYDNFGPVTATLTDCNFVDNSASIGGGIYWTTSDVSTVDCVFVDNSSYVGGALFSIDSAADILGCTFRSNMASGEANPSLPPEANEANEPNEPVIVYGAGGGLYIFTTDANIVDCVITENTATGSAGGVYLGGHPQSIAPLTAIPELKNCLVTKNIAGREGGGVSCNRLVEAKISNCTIADNELTEVPSYGGGLYCSYASTVDVIDSIIWGNTGVHGSQVAIEDDRFYPLPSTATITHSDIQVWQDPNAVGPTQAAQPTGSGDANNPDYFLYTSFDTGHSPSYGVDGWVGSDGIHRIAHHRGSYLIDPNNFAIMTPHADVNAYIHTVSILGGADPHAHPDNPYASGDIAPRIFTLERIFDLGVQLTHSDELYVDAENNVIYSGAYTSGIRKYVFNPSANNPVPGGPAGNYVYDSTIAPSAPEVPQSLSYDPDTDTWYAGSMFTWEVYKYDASQGPGGTWELAFAYPAMGTEAQDHHDGMEFINGYLYIADMYGDWVLQYTTDGTLVNSFYHQELPGGGLEGMGFGALQHFWAGTMFSTINEFGGGALQIAIEGGPTPPIYVERTCTLYGWEPNDPNDFWTWDVNSWSEDTNNIDADPLFVAGYYLSWVDAGQDANSPCVDRGSAPADDPNIGLHTYTTRTDGINDVNIVDMGYHYSEAITQYHLTISVVDVNGTPIVDPGLIYGSVAPSEPRPVDYNSVTSTYAFYANTQVTLTADPCEGYRVKAWSGTESEPAWATNENTVTMTGDKTVSVQFEPIPVYELTVTVVDGNGLFSVDPNTDLVADFNGLYLEGTEVTLRAEPNSGYYVKGWYDDGTRVSIDKVYEVVMDFNQDITVKFELPQDISVGQGQGYHYATIQGAVDAAKSGDRIIVYQGTYDGDINFDGREDIELVSARPDDPCFVANVIIDCQSGTRAFTFNHGEDADTLIDGFTIINGSSSDGPGGAIYIDSNTSPTLVNLVISDCSAAGSGGAIYVGSGSIANFRNVIINNCSATGADGGGIYVSSFGEPNFLSCTITNCSAIGGSGGGAYCATGSWPLFTDCTFADNRADYDGGALYYAYYSIAMLESCTFTNNTAGYGGGGISHDFGCVSQVTDCTFNSNVATEDGGGGILYGLNNLMAVTNCDFAGNTANYGGALYFDPNCLGTIVDSRLTDNGANGNGGAIFLDRGNEIDFNACDISDNTAACGGGLYCLDSPDSRIIACEIKRNKASGGVTVRYLYFERDPNDPNVPLTPDQPLDTSDPNFDPNDPDYIKVRREDYSDIAQGGGIYSWVGPRTIKDSEICYNTARTSGGGLYLVSDEDLESSAGQMLKNCLIANNRAGRDGGGISCNWRVEVTISNCTIADNKTTGIPSYGGGLYCSYESYAEVINSVIWGNEGKRGSQIAVGSGDWAWQFPSTVKVTYSDVQVFKEEPNEVEEPVVVVDPSLLGPNTPDYFRYWNLDTTDYNASGAYGVDGWVGSDGTDRIVFFQGSTAYILTVAIPAGANPHAHPKNPYAPGNIAERTFALERSFDLGVTLGHGNELYVDAENNVIYVGADGSGIRKYVFDSGADNPVDGGPAGNYVFDSTIAPATPSEAAWTQTLVYDPDNDVWYAGSIAWGETNREVWKYEGSQGSDGVWEIAFTYEGGDHHDGMEFINGYLYLADYQGDYIKKFSTDGTLIDVYYHEPLGHELEGMGFDALGHFWVGSHGNTISEFGGGALQIGIDVVSPTSPIYVGEDCELIGWAPADANDFWTWDVNSWVGDANTNIDEDPCFAADYYLSWADADQDIDSPCVNRGSANVNDPNVNLPPDEYTTRTDGIGDVGIVDMGYHHLIDFMPWLSVIVVDANGDPVDPGLAHGYVEPNDRPYPDDTEVELAAHPDYGYRVKEWNGTDDDSSTALNNTVTMTGDRILTVEFELTPIHWLTTEVGGGIGSIEPLSGPRFEGVIRLTANPGPSYRIKAWRGTDDDSSLDPNNTVTLDEDKTVGVWFDLPQTIEVSVLDEPNAIQDAIDAARSRDTLIVGAGTYAGGINLRGKDITITSTNPDDEDVVAATIIDCQQGGRAFIFDSGEDANTVIDGFTIVDASITGENGGAIYVDSNCSPTIINVVISNCSAVADPNEGGGGNGGGIYVTGDSEPTFVNCTITNCLAVGGGGAYCDSNSSPIFKHCTFSENSAQFGGGMLCDSERVIAVNDCNFANNTAASGAGLYGEPNSSVVVTGSIFIGNTADYDGGAMYWEKASMLITDSDIVDNGAQYGGGLYCIYSPETVIIDCTIKYNRAPDDVLDPNDPNDPNAIIVGQGGGIYCFATPALIRDCVIARNTANTSGGGVYLVGESNSPELINCLIISNWAGRDGGGISANWYADPLIANCTIVDNVAPGNFGQNLGTGLGGGFYCGYNSDSEIVDSIIWNNYALEGWEIAVATGFEFDPIPSTLTVTYSDVKGGQSAAKVGDYCTLRGWYPGDPCYPSNINADPLFVTGTLGDYYLSQTDAGQLLDSPCVNAGSDLATNLDMITNRNMDRYTTRTDEVLDKGTVDMGYHYTAGGEPCRFCDLIYDGVINFNDFALLALSWLDEGCSDGDDWCGGADLTLDGCVKFEDLAVFAWCWLTVDDEAPKPDPSEWQVEPYSTSATSIAMTAETAVDAWGWDVEYYFECISNGDFNSPDWQSSPIYEAAGLDYGIEYCFKVRARDGIPWIPDEVDWIADDGTGEPGNKTDWSKPHCAIAGGAPDTTPPAPAPVILTVEPNSPNSIIVTATVANDGSGVEYRFKRISPEYYSGWLSQPIWIDTGLDPNTQYCYAVQARDKSPQQNTTGWSAPLCGSTSVLEDKTPPKPDRMEWDPNGLPHEEWHGGNSSDYWAVMDAVQATDDSGFVEYKFICDDDRYSSGGESDPGPTWRNESNVTGDPWHFEVWVGAAGRIFEFQVVARDLYGNETAASISWPMN